MVFLSYKKGDIQKMKKYLPFFLLLGLIEVVIYLPIFPSFLFADDFTQIYDHSFATLPELFGKVAYTSISYLFRPIHYLFLGLLSKLVLLGPGFCYIPMFILHLLAAISVFYLVKETLKREDIAKLCSLLFLVFCGNWEVIGWSAVIYYPLVVIFMCWTVIFFLQKRTGMSILMFILALLTHEVAIVLLPLLYLYDISKRKLLSNAQKLVPLSIVAFVYLCFYFGRLLISPINGMAVQYKIGLHFLANSLWYLATLIIPVITSYSMSSVLPVHLIVFIDFVKLIVAIAIPFIALYLYFKGPEKIKFFILWTVLAVLPFSFFVTSPVSRYVYVASVGYCAILAIMIYKLPKKYIAIASWCLIIINIVAMLGFQTMFYKKKEIRRVVLSEIKRIEQDISQGAVVACYDLPIRTDEVAGMVSLFLKRPDIVIVDGEKDRSYQYVLIYKDREVLLKSY